MGTGYLIDSNAIIDFFNGSLPEKGRLFLFNVIPVISIVTFVELFSSNKASESEKIQLQRFTKSALIYDLDKVIGLRTIELRLQYKVKLPDAVIAATALYYNLTLVTRSISDFGKIDGLKIINPYSL